ncbi:Vha44 [Drosophila busckii]|uniref:V-type proton ATPase subunit C n=1 Tax=Drosophila busckii TaxID=30019 RepID=A0A0M4E5F5_DROBS|nr:Vha44 [Drosophila busckii]
MMSEYWIISAPGDKTCQQTFDTMNNLTSKQHNLCSNYKFHIPDLKVGTLDQLVGLSDDLGKLDTYVEQITRKVANYLGEVLEDQRDKLHENLMANNSPGPPDEMPCRHHQRLKHLSLRHQRKHQHTHHQNNPLSYHHHHHHHQLPTDLKGKCHHNLSNKSAAATTTATTATATTTTTMHASNASNASACASATASAYSASARPSAASAVAVASACPSCPLSGGSLTNLSSTHDESERDFDFVIPPGCACDECYSSSLFAPPSASATASTLMADECYSQTASSMLNATRCAISTVAAIATGSMSSMAGAGASTSVAAAANAAACCSSQSHATAADAAAAAAPAPAPAKTSSASTLSSSAYFSTSAPTASSSVHSMSRSNSKKLNNNTCSINNNKLSFRSSSSHVSQFNLPTPQSPQQKQPPMQLPGGGMLSPTPPLLSPTEKSTGDTDDEELEDPKSPHSASSLSETFDWWFNKPKRNSKKCRSSPVSSCCGSSSQGRSSPDTDHAEPPEFPLSPAELPQYLTRFQWDMAKYPIKQSLRNIADIISKQIGQIDADLKTKSQAYNNLKGNLQNLEKKKTGSLLTRNLADLVKKEHFILDSEYLTTLLVIVPKVMANEWLANYEKITDMIVPRSSQLIQEDSDYCLFTVTLFKKVTEEFKLHARERKFIVRDFVYNEEELAAGKNEMTKLMTDKKKQFGPLVRWLKVNFSEAFCALIHVKALRVFVESVLRYGLPVNFQAILIEPNKKSVKRLRDVLNQLYGHLDGASAGGHVSSADNVDIPGLGFGQSEYFPYVFYKVNIDMVEQTKL